MQFFDEQIAKSSAFFNKNIFIQKQKQKTSQKQKISNFLIFSFDEECFNEKNKFQDKYFKVLDKLIENQIIDPNDFPIS